MFTVLLAPTTTRAAAVERAAAPGVTVVLPVRDALAALPVRTESRTGYERTKFKHWTDADRDGCNTRMEVLKAEAVTAPVQGPTSRPSTTRQQSGPVNCAARSST
ncbi:hypothetical protein ACGFY7_49930 [Streptomyces prunicolor]|uniref:hypothetical protein n=1 Tax=Streptomyces prunicolor TaxID=67348 RepID=UPI00371C818C